MPQVDVESGDGHLDTPSRVTDGRRVIDDPFRRLGEALNTAWALKNFDELAFPTLAVAALAAAHLHVGFVPSDYLGRLLLQDTVVPQSDGSFGEPPIVAYRGRGFFIEVLYWLDATTDIHSHGFSGAFQVLHGASIHATYGFTGKTRVRSTLRFGHVAYRGVEHLHQGDVRPILAGERFIHALFHLARPSVSVVVRTTREQDHLPQMNYLPPFIAWDPLEEDRLRDRRAQALTVLLETDRPAMQAALEAIARDADLGTLFHALRHLTKHIVTPAELAHYTGIARMRHGELADQLLASLLEDLRQRHITARRANVQEPHLRWILALLLNVPTRRDLLRLVSDAGFADPISIVIEGLRGLARSHGPSTTTLLDLQVGHDEGGSERVVTLILAVIRAMMNDASIDAISSAAELAVSGLMPAERDGIAGLVHDLKRPASPFLNLFR